MYLLHQLLAGTAREHPQRTAVAFCDETLTYEKLDAASDRIAVALAAHGVVPGDRVGIMLHKSLESIIALFAVLKVGAVYVPLDPLAPPARTLSIIGNCAIRLIFATRDLLAALVGEGESCLEKAILCGPLPDRGPDAVDCLGWETALSACLPRQFIPLNLSDAAPAYILHTSGSTGIPKGVAISHRNALTFVDMATDFFGIGHGDRLANHAPLHFDLSVFDIFCAVKAGAAIVLVPEFLSAFPVRLAEFVDRRQVTVWNSVASVLTKLAAQGALERFRFQSLRLVHFSGDLMPVKYLRVLMKCMPSAVFYNIYGQTEANSSLYFRVPEQMPEMWKVPIGRPFPNFEVFAVDGEGRVVSEPGGEGELHVLSSTVALGYWNAPEKTAQQFVADPRSPLSGSRVYKTGDLARLDGEGNFFFSGRSDHMVKAKGYRVELDEIEIVLNSDPRIRQAAVVAVPDEVAGNRIVAYLTLQDGIDVDLREFQDLCGEHLPKYMVPEAIRCRQSLPTTPNDKVNRRALVQEFLDEKSRKH